MSLLLWKIKSRLETFLYTSKVFDNLIKNALTELSNNDIFFVEIGANDGISNDLLYQFVLKNNWSGLYVEPQKDVYDKLVNNLKGIKNIYFENVAIINGESKELSIFVPKDSSIKDFTGIASLDRQGGVLSRFKNDELVEQKIQGKPFSYLVDKYELAKKSNLLVLIDVEGLEKQIIYSIDFNKIKPKIILFEHAHMTYDCHREVNGYLTRLGYKIYVAKFDTFAYRK
jgi:FkbM family methyltransferase